MDWNTALEGLRRWHDLHDREAAHAAFTFLEVQLRLMVPPIVRRKWPEDLVEDALRSFLKKLLEKQLADVIENPRAFIATAFQNHCLDLRRSQKRRPAVPASEVASEWENAESRAGTPEGLLAQKENENVIRAAFDRLEIADRIALKLEHAPEWLTDDELRWLADRAGLGEDELRPRLLDAREMYDLTLIFNPEPDDPEDPDPRRKRMERFRKRRSRARGKLKALLREGNR